MCVPLSVRWVQGANHHVVVLFGSFVLKHSFSHLLAVAWGLAVGQKYVRNFGSFARVLLRSGAFVSRFARRTMGISYRLEMCAPLRQVFWCVLPCSVTVA